MEYANMKWQNNSNVFHWRYLSFSPARTNVELFLGDLEQLVQYKVELRSL